MEISCKRRIVDSNHHNSRVNTFKIVKHLKKRCFPGHIWNHQLIVGAPSIHELTSSHTLILKSNSWTNIPQINNIARFGFVFLHHIIQYQGKVMNSFLNFFVGDSTCCVNNDGRVIPNWVEVVNIFFGPHTYWERVDLNILYESRYCFSFIFVDVICLLFSDDCDQILIKLFQLSVLMFYGLVYFFWHSLISKTSVGRLVCSNPRATTCLAFLSLFIRYSRGPKTSTYTFLMTYFIVVKIDIKLEMLFQHGHSLHVTPRDGTVEMSVEFHFPFRRNVIWRLNPIQQGRFWTLFSIIFRTFCVHRCGKRLLPLFFVTM